MPPTLREAAEEVMLAIKGAAEFCNKTLDEYINGPGWTNPHWKTGLNMLREAIAAHDAVDDTAALQAAIDGSRIWYKISSDNGLFRIDKSSYAKIRSFWQTEASPPQTALPPLRWTERRDPCSADARGEWTDFD